MASGCRRDRARTDQEIIGSRRFVARGDVGSPHLRHGQADGTDFVALPMPPLARADRMLPRGAIARAWCTLVAISVLFGIMQAGTRYFYCEALGLSTVDPCTGEARHEPPCPLASLDRTRFDSCKVITMPAMPEGARPSEPSVAPASVVALVPPALDGDALPPKSRAHGARDRERWRGPPRASRERRAQLMVFLT